MNFQGYLLVNIHCGLDASWTDSVITNEMFSCDMNWDSFEHAGSVEVDKMLLRFTLLPLCWIHILSSFGCLNGA